MPESWLTLNTLLFNFPGLVSKLAYFLLSASIQLEESEGKVQSFSRYKHFSVGQFGQFWSKIKSNSLT